MSTWVPLQASKHQHTHWRKFTDYHFSAADKLAPVVVAELNELLPHYLLAFSLRPGSSPQAPAFELVALLGSQGNAYLHPQQGRWMAPYVPAYYRGYPFRLLPQPNSPSKSVLCVDSASELLSETANPKSQPLLNEQGQPTSELGAVIDFLTQTEKNRLLTHQLLDQLQAAELIQPWLLTLQADSDQKAQQLQGLYRVEEERLRQLPGAQLEKLAQSGALTLAYGQLLTQGRVKDLQKRLEFQQQSSGQPNKEIDLDQVFGEANEDVFKF